MWPFSEGCLLTSLSYCEQQAKAHMLFVVCQACVSSPCLILTLLEEEAALPFCVFTQCTVSTFWPCKFFGTCLVTWS